MAAGRKQFAVPQAAAKLVAEVSYETAHVSFTDLAGISLSTERMHILTNQLAKGLGVLDVAPLPHEVVGKTMAVSNGCHRPIRMFAPYLQRQRGAKK